MMNLRAMQTAQERSMMGLRLQDREEANWIGEQTKVRDILETVYQMKWNWACHIHRRDDDRWTRKITEWKLKAGMRAVGRPKLRWSDDINNFIKEKD